ncbi:hypothetical protein SETIT_3G187300v2 [Setaria italica]|uniref:Uncharacterized protein n=1 Tax=Setaria italica TaxID=4555 RepID=A0A368QGK8_SETIT|nr:hypothetical protein SETIT_3G187300v2 [Setaria italica]
MNSERKAAASESPGKCQAGSSRNPSFPRLASAYQPCPALPYIRTQSDLFFSIQPRARQASHAASAASRFTCKSAGRIHKPRPAFHQENAHGANGGHPQAQDPGRRRRRRVVPARDRLRGRGPRARPDVRCVHGRAGRCRRVPDRARLRLPLLSVPWTCARARTTEWCQIGQSRACILNSSYIQH